MAGGVLVHYCLFSFTTSQQHHPPPITLSLISLPTSTPQLHHMLIAEEKEAFTQQVH
jgi:hypothetical protein